MKTLLIGAAAAGLVGVTMAAAQSSSSQSTTSPTSQSSATTSPSGQSSATTSPSSQSSTSQSTSTQTGTTASSSKELSGVVKKVDKDKRSVKISSPTGGEQEVKVAPNATVVTSDGTQAGLDQLKEGDQVRASLDPSSNQATKLEVQSKQPMDKDKSGKTDSKGASDTKSDSKKY
jgi:Cu/Ag efflux protein CusF